MSNEPVTDDVCKEKHSSIDDSMDRFDKLFDKLFAKVDRIQWFIITTLAGIIILGIKGCI